MNLKKEVDAVKSDVETSKKGQNHKFYKIHGAKNWQDQKKGNDPNKKNTVL